MVAKIIGKRKYKKRKDMRPFKDQKRTYLQGTILRLFNYHTEITEQSSANYLRSLVIADLKSRYEITATGGVVKIKKG